MLLVVRGISEINRCVMRYGELLKLIACVPSNMIACLCQSGRADVRTPIYHRTHTHTHTGPVRVKSARALARLLYAPDLLLTYRTIIHTPIKIPHNHANVCA